MLPIHFTHTTILAAISAHVLLTFYQHLLTDAICYLLLAFCRASCYLSSAVTHHSTSSNVICYPLLADHSFYWPLAESLPFSHALNGSSPPRVRSPMCYQSWHQTSCSLRALAQHSPDYLTIVSWPPSCLLAFFTVYFFLLNKCPATGILRLAFRTHNQAIILHDRYLPGTTSSFLGKGTKKAPLPRTSCAFTPTAYPNNR